LENPFRNIPNELPVVTLMAEFNEALITMYAGYHPDSFWEPQKDGPVHNINLDVLVEASEEDDLDSSNDFLVEEKTGSGKTATTDQDWDTSTESLLEKSIKRTDKEQEPAPADKEQPHIIIPTEQQQSEEKMAQQQQQQQQQAEVDQLRAIVVQQGMIMAKMLEEQARLNQMIQATFDKK
jgi:hypothetical protein